MNCQNMIWAALILIKLIVFIEMIAKTNYMLTSYG